MVDDRIKIADPADNVATSFRTLEANERIAIAVDDRRYELRIDEEVPLGHKVAIRDIDAGETVIKYGRPIGYAVQPIEVGERVHVHNVASNYGSGDDPND